MLTLHNSHYMTTNSAPFGAWPIDFVRYLAQHDTAPYSNSGKQHATPFEQFFLDDDT